MKTENIYDITSDGSGSGYGSGSGGDGSGYGECGYVYGE